jgi:hypothetical protein
MMPRQGARPRKNANGGPVRETSSLPKAGAAGLTFNRVLGQESRLEPTLMRAVERQHEDGTEFVTPTMTAPEWHRTAISSNGRQAETDKIIVMALDG